MERKEGRGEDETNKQPNQLETDVGARTITMPCDDRTPEQPTPVVETSDFDAILLRSCARGPANKQPWPPLEGRSTTAVTEAQSTCKGGRTILMQ